MDLPILQSNVGGGGELRSVQFEQTADVALAAATDTPLGEIPVNGDAGPVMIAITNTGGNPFTACLIGAIPTPNTPVPAGNLYPAYITSAQLNTGTGIADLLVAVSGNPTTLAAGATVVLTVKANSAYRLQVRATSTLGTTARVRASLAKST